MNPTNTTENAVPSGCDSLAKLFVRRVEERGDATAICDKRHGIWQSISWREYGDRARAIATGLAALDMRPGGVVNILAESVPEWLFADMGAICAGCVSVGIYPTSTRYWNGAPKCPPWRTSSCSIWTACTIFPIRWS